MHASKCHCSPDWAHCQVNILVEIVMFLYRETLFILLKKSWSLKAILLVSWLLLIV